MPGTPEFSLFPQSSRHSTDSFKLPGLSSARQTCTEVHMSYGQSGLKDFVNRKHSTQEFRQGRGCLNEIFHAMDAA